MYFIYVLYKKSIIYCSHTIGKEQFLDNKKKTFTFYTLAKKVFSLVFIVLISYFEGSGSTTIT